jgi:hypothetical protein
VVLADSRRISRVRRYLGTLTETDYLSRTGLLPTLARLSKTLPLGISFVTRVRGLVPPTSGPATPNWQRHQAIPPVRFRLIPFRSPLLRESQLFSSPRVTEMFQFTRFPLPALCVQAGVTPHDGCGVSPFGYPRIEAWSAAPRGFSQPPTSFFGFRRQGIHRWLFVAWRIIKMLVLALKFSRYNDKRRPLRDALCLLGSKRSQKTEQRDYPNLRDPAGMACRSLGLIGARSDDQ